MDPFNFKAPYIEKSKIWENAEAFREKFCPQGEVPFPIMDIVEFDLDIQVETIKDLKSSYDVDALLLSDLKTIIVDRLCYMDDRLQNRVRFSIAHEIGHRELHSEIYKGIQYNSVDDWIQFQQKMPEDQWNWFELHANEFAGRLLVPADILQGEVETAKEQAQQAGFTKWDESKDEAISYMASRICRKFEVSAQVVERRIRHEQLY